MPTASGATLSSVGKQLVVEDLSVEFGSLRALDGVSLSAGQGVVGLIGPNGAGKTTLFNVICGFVRPTSGRLSYGDAGLGRHHPHDLSGLGIARTLQGVGLCRTQSVLENVMLGAEARARCDIVSALLGSRRSSKEERRIAARAHQLLDELDVGAYARRRAGELPYGVQKKVALARALIAEPELLLLDEPASGLSEVELGELGERIRSLGTHLAVLLVEHRMDLVNAVCDRVVVLNFGQVIAEGTAAEIRDNPEVAAAYLGGAVATATTGTAGTAGPGPGPR